MPLTYQERLKAINDFQAAIEDVYDERKLVSLRGINFKIGDKNILKMFFDAVNKGQLKYPDVKFHEVFDDLVFCSDEIMYFTGQLFLYRPYMNNPHQQRYWLGNSWVYPDMQNLPAKRYAMAAGTILEKIYNYWDRIGDLINVYFPGLLNAKRVFFPSVIDSIPPKFRTSENFQWLKNFKETMYSEFNLKRIDIVHYITNDTAFRHQALEAVANEQAILTLVKERDALPEYFQKHMDVIIEGFLRTVAFVEEVTKATLMEEPKKAD